MCHLDLRVARIDAHMVAPNSFRSWRGSSPVGSDEEETLGEAAMNVAASACDSDVVSQDFFFPR